MDKVNKYVIVHKPMYYYLQSGDSIVGSYTLRHLDIIKGLKERHSFLEVKYPRLLNDSYKVMLKANLLHYNLLKSNKDIDINGSNREDIREYIKKNYETFKNSVNDDKELKNTLVLFNKNYELSKLYEVLNKVLRRLKIKHQAPYLKRIDI